MLKYLEKLLTTKIGLIIPVVGERVFAQWVGRVERNRHRGPITSTIEAGKDSRDRYQHMISGPHQCRQHSSKAPLAPGLMMILDGEIRSR